MNSGEGEDRFAGQSAAEAAAAGRHRAPDAGLDKSAPKSAGEPADRPVRRPVPPDDRLTDVIAPVRDDKPSADAREQVRAVKAAPAWISSRTTRRYRVSAGRPHWMRSIVTSRVVCPY